MKVLVLGAHPDDCDIYAGGSAILWRRRGDWVRFVSVTDGGAGHQSMRPVALAARRRSETQKAAELADIEYDVLGVADGQVMPTLENREALIRLIRSYAPDLVLTHRSNDYHPDHRYTSILVQDSAYMVTAPLVCPDVPHLQRNPVIAYLFDAFQKPTPFRVDVAIDVGPAMRIKWQMLHAHASQFYEWLPYNQGVLDTVPTDEAARLDWLKESRRALGQQTLAASRVKLQELYGAARASEVQDVEAFEISEFGRQPEPDELARLFPIGVDPV